MHFLSSFTTDLFHLSVVFVTTVKAAWIKEQNFQEAINCITYPWVPILKAFRWAQDFLYG